MKDEIEKKNEKELSSLSPNFLTCLTLSIPDWIGVSPEALSTSKTLPASSSWIPRSWIPARVVTSAHPTSSP